MITMKVLENLKLHEQIDNGSSNKRVMRVPGGLIYTFHDMNGWTLSSTFVPFVEDNIPGSSNKIV